MKTCKTIKQNDSEYCQVIGICKLRNNALSEIETVINIMEQAKLVLLKPKHDQQVNGNFEEIITIFSPAEGELDERVTEWIENSRPVILSLYRRLVIIKLNTPYLCKMKTKNKLTEKILNSMFKGFDILIRRIEETN